MRRISRSARILAGLPLLLLLQGQHAKPDRCRYPSDLEPLIEPLYFVPAVAAGRPVALVPEAVLAHEVAHVAPHGWMLGDDVALPSPGPLFYPAGTPLSPSWIDGRMRQCLPGAPDRRAASSGRRSRIGLVRIPCMSDDGREGAYEEIEIFNTRPWMHVVRHSRETVIRLPVPVRLVADPQGRNSYRRHIHRRVRVAEIQGSTARLVVEHAFHLQIHGENAFAEASTGALAFRPARPGGELMGEPPSELNYRPGNEDSPDVELADGALVEAGGLRFRIARAGRGWTMTPLADRFPRWISLQCDDRHFVLGAPRTPL